MRLDDPAPKVDIVLLLITLMVLIAVTYSAR